MTKFGDRPIPQKFICLVMATVVVALLLACATSVVIDSIDIRENLGEELAATADLVGGGSTAALAFEDRKTSAESLSALRRQTRITAGCIYSKKGRLFASYLRDPGTSCPSQIQRDGVYLTRLSLSTFKDHQATRRRDRDRLHRFGLEEASSAADKIHPDHVFCSDDFDSRGVTAGLPVAAHHFTALAAIGECNEKGL